ASAQLGVILRQGNVNAIPLVLHPGAGLFPVQQTLKIARQLLDEALAYGRAFNGDLGEILDDEMHETWISGVRLNGGSRVRPAGKTRKRRTAVSPQPSIIEAFEHGRSRP